MSDEGPDLTGNQVPMRTLKFNFGTGILLGEGDGVVSMKRGLVAEENVGDNSSAGIEK